MYLDIFGDEVNRTFSVPVDRGYVREGSRQTCERLHCMGSTLMATRETLLAVIRREYRAMYRQNLKDQKNYA